MALITCLDCGAPVSDEARACPKCGRPFPGYLRPKAINGGFLVFIISALALAAIVVLAASTGIFSR
jgi:ribosomal protein L40E